MEVLCRGTDRRGVEDGLHVDTVQTVIFGRTHGELNPLPPTFRWPDRVRKNVRTMPHAVKRWVGRKDDGRMSRCPLGQIGVT